MPPSVQFQLQLLANSLDFMTSNAIPRINSDLNPVVNAASTSNQSQWPSSSPRPRRHRSKLAKAQRLRLRKSRIQYHFTIDELRPYFHMSQRDAAKLLGVAVITLKRICKRNHFNWPYRASKARLAQERNQQRMMMSLHQPNSPPLSEEYTTSDIGSTDDELEMDRPPCLVDDKTFEHEDMRRSFDALVLCASRLNKQEMTAAHNMSAAAKAFSRLPFICMTENVA